MNDLNTSVSRYYVKVKKINFQKLSRELMKLENNMKKGSRKKNLSKSSMWDNVPI